MYFDAKATGERIHQLRRSRGLTQEQLADSLNTSDRHIRRLEIGESACSIDLFVEVAHFFGVSLDYLILGKKTANNQFKQTLNFIASLLWQMAREI